MNGARMTDTEGALLPHHGADLSLRRSGTLLVRASSISVPEPIGQVVPWRWGRLRLARAAAHHRDVERLRAQTFALLPYEAVRTLGRPARDPSRLSAERLRRRRHATGWDAMRFAPPGARRPRLKRVFYRRRESNPRPQPADSRARHREQVVRLPGLLTKLDGAPGANRDFASALLSAQDELRKPFRDDCGNGVLLFSESVCSGCGQVCDRPSGGVPNGSLSPCTTRVGTFTASSSARRQRSL
jgi:hypothetical protein